MSTEPSSPVHTLVKYASIDDVKQFVPHAVEVRYKPGQFLFYEGHRPYGVYLVRSGEVELFQTESGNPMDEPEFSCVVNATADDGRHLILASTLLAREGKFPLNGRAKGEVEGAFIDHTVLRGASLL